jgi:hypothetical protein
LVRLLAFGAFTAVGRLASLVAPSAGGDGSWGCRRLAALTKPGARAADPRRASSQTLTVAVERAGVRGKGGRPPRYGPDVHLPDRVRHRRGSTGTAFFSILTRRLFRHGAFGSSGRRSRRLATSAGIGFIARWAKYQRI